MKIWNKRLQHRTFLLSLLTLVWINVPAAAVIPGTPCKNASSLGDCDEGVTFMTCQQDTQCDCDDKNNFDYSANQCRLKLGEKCHNPLLQPSERLPANAECTATTSTEGFVLCPIGFIDTPSGKCARPHNANCSNSTPPECDEDSFVFCLAGACSCKQDSTYIDGVQACQLNAKMRCQTVINPGPPVQTCREFSHCKENLQNPLDKRCTCNDGLEVNAIGECRAKHGKVCDPAQLPCDQVSYFSCSLNYPNLCECENSANAFYDRKMEMCKILVNGMCEPDIKKQPCVDFAKCEQVLGGGGFGQYFCQCPQGLMASQGRQCVIPYEQPCANPSKGPYCNAELFHVCINNRCGCGANAWYEANTQNCLLLAGAPCAPGGQLGSQQCTPNSFCMPTTASPLGGFCTCNNGLIPNADRKCFLNYGSPCTVTNSMCDTTRNLACNPVTSKCDCANSMTSVYEDGECRLRSTAECNPAPSMQVCVAHAACVPDGYNTYRCACSGAADMVNSQQGKCVRRYGSQCGIPGLNGTCNADGFQGCIEGRCSCLDQVRMKYNEKDNSCYLKQNSTCSIANGIPCEPKLFCDITTGTCQCDPSQGLSDDGNGVCVKSLGSPCSPLDGLNGGCNANEYLDCVAGACKCEQNYEAQQPGGVGGSEPGPGQGSRCVGNYRAPCKTSRNCNANNSLVCDAVTNNCMCPTLQQVYDVVLQKCYSSTGGACHLVNTSTPVSGDVILNCHPQQKLRCYSSSTPGPDPNIGTCRCEDYNVLYDTCSGVDLKFYPSIILAHLFLYIITKLYLTY